MCVSGIYPGWGRSMTTVCFLPPGPSACGGHQRWGFGCPGPGGRARGWAGLQGPIPLLSSSPLLLQRGAGPPGPALLLAPNQFFLLWGPTAAPRPTATTIHGSHWAERNHSITASRRVCACWAPSLTSPTLRIHPPPGIQGILDSQSNHDPSRRQILP